MSFSTSLFMAPRLIARSIDKVPLYRSCKALCITNSQNDYHFSIFASAQTRAIIEFDQNVSAVDCCPGIRDASLRSREVANFLANAVYGWALALPGRRQAVRRAATARSLAWLMLESPVIGRQAAEAARDPNTSFVNSLRGLAMTKYKLEYIWLDGYTPTPNLRGKTQIKEFDTFPSLGELPLWGFDGSSTMQAEGHNSDCVLKPVAVYPDGARTNGVLVMCEVMMPDGKTPHPSNMRATILDDSGAWFGFEQEYFFYQDGRPLGFPSSGYPAPQGPYYTGVGYKNVGDIARKMVEEHLDLCLAAGINHEGINAEVAKGQWEFQIFGKGSKKAADEMWMARYLMLRLTEKYGVDIEFHCKPLGDTDWNGSGMHANFSTAYMREVGGKEYFEAMMKAFKRIATITSRFMAPTITCG